MWADANHDRVPHQDEALPIGYSQTVSAPHMHAAALELLQDKLHPGATALDVGSGAASSRHPSHALHTIRCGFTCDPLQGVMHSTICSDVLPDGDTVALQTMPVNITPAFFSAHQAPATSAPAWA